MLTNESGYIFVVLNKHNKIAGLFHRIETTLESIRMSVTDIDPNPELELRHGRDLHADAGVWLNGEYVCSVIKWPTHNIAVGMVEISMA